MRGSILSFFLGSSLALGGCAASIAASAIGAAVRSAQSQQQAGRAPLAPQAAADACEVHASQHGQVKIIDVENRRDSKLIVWGTVEKDQVRRSFECSYSGKVSGFKLRSIASN